MQHLVKKNKAIKNLHDYNRQYYNVIRATVNS